MDTRHYTQTPSELRTACDLGGASVRVHGGGFVTRDMVGATLDQWHRDGGPASHVLVDLRDVAGYESGFTALAAQLLRGAHSRGVRRIAFVASSTALRAAASVVAPTTGVQVRFFHDDLAAKRWLERPQR